MAGGTWTTQNKVRPGVYVNVVGNGQPVGTLGARGIAAIALSLSWGAPKVIHTLQAGENPYPLLGYDLTAPQLLPVREALKRAQTLLLYRLNTGTKATATHGGLTISAKYGGARGNDIDIVVSENVDEETLYDVVTLFAGAEVDFQTVATIDELADNAWVDFSGTGALTTTAGVPLVGGADGSVANQDHADFLAALELREFNTVAYPGTDATLKGVYSAFARRLRDDEGKKIQVVMENYSTADYEGVISVKNGVVLADGTTLTAAQATAWVAGATAGAAVNESLTYAAYDDAVDANPRYTNSQIITALQAGEFLFTPSNGRAVVEQDINSFTSYTPDKPKSFGKNRVLRVLDGINNDFVRIFSSQFLGKVSNNAHGRNLLKAECINHLNTLQGISAIQNFDSQTDLTVSAGTDSDAVVIGVDARPVDSIEKIYITVKVG